MPINTVEIVKNPEYAGETDDIYSSFSPSILLNGQELKLLQKCSIIIESGDWSKVILEFPALVKINLPVYNEQIKVKRRLNVRKRSEEKWFSMKARMNYIWFRLKRRLM